MNICSFIIITFLCIAGSTSASFEAFEDDFSLDSAVKAYCLNPKSFRGEKKYGPIEGWNVSAVTNMVNLFSGLSNCNPPISKWDVSAVTTFRGMFHGAAVFNQDLSEWNVATSQNFKEMFYGAAAFNQDLSEWNVATSQIFDSMFYGAAAFNQDLSEWNVANSQNFHHMFYGAAEFNQDLSRWNVGNGQTFRYMFKDSGLGLGLGFCIGDWKFTSMGNGLGRLSIFLSMLDVTFYHDYDDDISHEQWDQQLKNLGALVFCTKKIDNDVADLIALDADKGMRGKKIG